jgi:outer membrane protein TolC
MNLSKKFFILFLVLVCIAPIRVGASSILTLKEVINKGLENDPQLIASKKRIQELKSELSIGAPFLNWNWDVTVKTADLTYSPTKGAEISPFTAVLSGGAKLGDYVSIRGSLTRPREESKVPESLTLSYSRQIFSNPAYSDKSLNALKGEIELAKAQIDYESKVADVTLQIVKDYLRYLSLKEDFEKTKENLERVELMDKEVSIKYDLGYVSTLDMLSSQLMLKEAEVSFNGSQASYEKQITSFLKSLKINEDLGLEDIRDSIDIEINLTPGELIDIAISNSGELEKLKLDIMYEHIQLNKIKTKDRPIIKVEGSYDPIRGDAGIFIFNIKINDCSTVFPITRMSSHVYHTLRI